jgi:hypothetical protein
LSIVSLSHIPIIGKSTLTVGNAVSGNAKQGSGQPMESDTSKKHKGEPRTGISTPAQDTEQVAPPAKKKKTKANADSAQPSAVATILERNHSAPSNMTSGTKKRPSRADNDASIDGNPVTPHPKKKAKIDVAALPKVPLHRTGNC